MIFWLGFGVFTTVAQVHPWLRKLRAHKWLSMAKRGGGESSNELIYKTEILTESNLIVTKVGSDKLVWD